MSYRIRDPKQFAIEFEPYHTANEIGGFHCLVLSVALSALHIFGRSPVDGGIGNDKRSVVVAQQMITHYATQRL